MGELRALRWLRVLVSIAAGSTVAHVLINHEPVPVVAAVAIGLAFVVSLLSFWQTSR